MKEHVRAQIQHFWDGKILGWEKNRYDKNDLAGKPLKARMDFARQWLVDKPKEGLFMELGAGSSRLLETILHGYPDRQYHGVDISSEATKKAQLRALELGFNDRANFETSSLSSLSERNCKVIFSLGLIDWLDSEEIKKLADLSKDKIFLHSFSEKRIFSPTQILHRLYTWLSYGLRNGHYRPKYHTREELIDLFGPITFIQKSGMGFAMFFMSKK